MEENLLKKFRKRAGYSQREVAEALHVTQGAVSSWEAGRWEPDQQNLSALADLFGVSVDALIGREVIEPRPAWQEIKVQPELVPEDEVMIPVVASLRCGFGRSGEAIFKDKKPVPRSYVKRWGDSIVYYEAVGESMSPTITPGDLLVTVPGSVWEDGWIVVVDVNDSDTIKRIYRAEDGGIDLVPDNVKYKPMHLTPEDLMTFNVAVLGHVVKPIGPDL
jgi:transcriptional regulator with XRE-family HTH domain